jgi:hypothetical protein
MTGSRVCLALAELFLATSCASPSVRRGLLGHRPEVTLAAGGTASYVITLAESATPPERHAAQELAVYLRKVSGAEFAIVTPLQASGRPVIAVGPGAAGAVWPGLDLSRAGEHGLGDDGIVLQTVGPHIVLSGAGGAKRGTLYAVYEFLERDVGVRWWTPAAESVPHAPTLRVSVAATRYVPRFAYRETLCRALYPQDGDPEGLATFAVRRRQTGHSASIPADWGGHYTLIGWCHTFETLMPPARYFRDHPQWYSEVNGQRQAEESQLCLTNDAMLAELSRNVLARIRAEPDAGMISVAQNDWGNPCQCARCRALDEQEGSSSGSVLYGINKVAEAVEREFPGFYVETLAYSYSRKPPRTIRPRHNVIVRLSVIERSPVQPIEHPVNKPLLRDLQAWAAVAPNLYIWDYTANLVHPFTPEPRTRVFGPDLRLYERSGAISVFCEHNHGACLLSDFDELHTWLLSHLLWNPNQDDRALVREFLDGYYGAAGDAIGRYLDLLAERIGEHRIPSWCGARDAEWLDLATLNRATELLDGAVAAVAADATLTARVRRARLSLDHQWLCCYAGYRSVANAQNLAFRGPADFEQGLAEFASRCRTLGVTEIGYGETQTLDAYVASLRRAGGTVAARFELASLPAYQAYLAGARMPLPAALAAVRPADVVNVEEDRMTLFDGAGVAVDHKAANGAAARMDPAMVNWAVQLRDLPGKGGKGRWHAYAMIRVEAMAERGLAFTGGVYDGTRRCDLLGISQRLEGGQGGEPDPNVATQRTIALAEPITDGAYRLYDFGTHTFDPGVYLWIGTTGGVDPKAVKAIYVDRFILVKEDSR